MIVLKVTPSANDDMVQGYRDGLNLISPEPSSNRSFSYRHGFRNGRADRFGKPFASYEDLCTMAEEALLLDGDGEK